MRARRLAPLVVLGLALGSPAALAAPAVTSPRLKVDQFGWHPDATKIAVLDEPVQGFDAPDPFAPDAVVEVRRWADDAVAGAFPAVPWRAGAVHAQSGNRTWHVDFSSLTSPGSYYVHDPATGASSGRFEISPDAHRELLRQALRSFFLQRCGVAKDAAHAGAAWADGACHVGAQQDLDCRLVTNPAGSPGRDLSGGWHDAGDYNKYVNFTDDPVHELLAAYENYPDAFDDAAGIPESGNGVPDVLDEVRFQLEWFLRMQLPDGSVLHKVSVTDWSAASPPSADAGARRHAPPTASATISACGAFAHGAIVFERLPDASSQAFGARLRAAALAAWGWLEANPGLIPSSYGNAGFVNVSAEDSAYDQAANRTCAAAYLLVLTGDARFRDHFDATYRAVHLVEWTFAYPFESTYQDGLLYYSRSPIAIRATVNAIRTAFETSMIAGENLPAIEAGDDPYGAFLADRNYTWGSNWTKAKQGGMYLAMGLYGMDSANAAAHRDAAAAYLHYLCGVNPLGIAMFSNMDALGAERSVRSFYHSWFADGSDWDEVGTSRFGPPPGFVPGGPNPSYAPDPAYGGPPIEPPMNQPIQKSFLDWNASWPENSWEVTENQCAYQAAVIKLIAAHVPAPSVAPLAITGPLDAAACAGGAARLEVSASGGVPPYAYQWRQDGADVAGATANPQDLAPLLPSHAGSWDVVVRDSAGASATSGAARVDVLQPPGSPGGSLRASKVVRDVALTWAAGAGATSHAVLRCDATLAACVPSAWRDVPGTTTLDAAPPERLVFYLVTAVNACGSTD